MPPPSCLTHIDELLRQVIHTIDRFNLFSRGDTVLVGVSGGADSVALLHILFDLAPRLQIRLGAGYLNHGLRPAAARQESLFVMGLADRLGLAGHTDQVNLDIDAGSLEDRARTARYRFFAQTARDNGYNKIALAHHADDNAELVLMRLLRGSGSRGLAGIPPVRAGGIVRPLIAVRKNQLLDYLRQRGLTYMEDASNSDPRFLRNRVRHQLLPLLERQFNPSVVATLNRMADRFREEEAWAQDHLAPLARCLMTHQEVGAIELDGELLRAQPRAVQRRLLRTALQSWLGSLWGIGADHVEALIELNVQTDRHRKLHLPGGIHARQSGTALRLTLCTMPRGKPASSASQAFTYSVRRPEKIPLVAHIAETGCRMTFTLFSRIPPKTDVAGDEKVAWFDADQLAFPLLIRNFCPGDRLQPLGMRGTQKLQDLFVNRKIGVSLRTRLPLLFSQGEIIWVAGVRRSAQALITKDSTHLLRVEAVWEKPELFWLSPPLQDAR
jgi:tRNA(Ile)-lysidine synthase